MNKTDFNNQPEKDRMNRVLEGTAFYACVHAPNYKQAKMFNSQPAFMVSLGLDDEGVKKANEYGLKVHQPDEFISMPYVKIQRKVREGKTVDEVKPTVVDSVQKKIPANILVGNGSKILCKFGTYWYENGGGGVGTALFKVQVRELVAFNPHTEDKQLIMDEGGFTVDNTDVPFEVDADGFDKE